MNKQKRFSIGGLLIAQTLTFALINNAQASELKHALATPIVNVIIGGGARPCLSSKGIDNPTRCTKPWTEIIKEDPSFHGLSIDNVMLAAPAETEFNYTISAERLATLNAVPSVLISDEKKRAIADSLSTFLRTDSASVRTPMRFEEFRKIAGESAVNALSKPEIAVLRQLFVTLLTSPLAPRLRELSTLRFQKNKSTGEVFRAIVQGATAIAGHKKPKIGVITAAVENAFYEHDINVYGLTSAGADVTWIPLDGGMRQALDRHDCANLILYSSAYSNKAAERNHFHMDRLFPDLAAQHQAYCDDSGAKLNALLESLDAVFFIGGDQSRILESFVSKANKGLITQASPQLRILQKRHAAGKLLISGTSAGDAIQVGGIQNGKPLPMIAGGDSWKTLVYGYSTVDGLHENNSEDASNLKTGLRFPQGGLGFFSYGVLDSHFSKRTREARLTRLVQESGVRYGFGVDENTAMQVHQRDERGNTAIEIVGEAGVFIIDVKDAQASIAKTGIDRFYRIEHARAHYVTQGDTILIQKNGTIKVQFASDKIALPFDPTAAAVRQTRVMEYGTTHFLHMAQQMGKTGAGMALGTSEGTKGQDAPFYSAKLERDPSTSFSARANGQVSYRNVLLSFEPCGEFCTLSKRAEE